jgi:hypothetical protein
VPLTSAEQGGQARRFPLGDLHMLDAMNPVLKDRLLALGTFSGIAIAAVAGVEMVIGGGFDFLLPGEEIREVAPSAYVHVVDEPWAQQTTYVPLTSTEYLFAGDDQPSSEERLAGAYDDADAPEGGYPAVDEDQLYANIDALYARQDARATEVAHVAYESQPIEQADDPYVLYVDEKKAEEAQTY